MKRIATLGTLLLLASVPLLAADPPATPLPLFKTPSAVCGAQTPKGAAMTPKPSFKSIVLTMVPPACVPTTACPGGGYATCPSYPSDIDCWSLDGCWADCGDHYEFCPGAESDPACRIA